MPIASAILIVITAFFTAFLSGIFGMAGGLILMGVLATILPIPQAMVTHGALQITANSWRAFLLRRHIHWRIIGFFLVGALVAAGVFFLLTLHPQKPMVFLLLGSVPFLVWLPRRWIHLDARKPLHAIMCGFLASGFSIVAGISSTLIDIFFVHTSLTRHEIVATKAITQIIGHSIKILYWGLAIVRLNGAHSWPPLWLFALAIPLSMSGTWLGGQVLNRFSDRGFVKTLRLLISAIGLFYIGRGVHLLFF